MSRPTAAQLIERLRTVHEAKVGRPLSDEELAGRLPITLSTFNRWKKADTKAFQSTLTMLEEAGWLADSEPGSAEAEPEESIDGRLQVLQARVDELPTAADLQRLGQTMRRAIARANQAKPETQTGSN